jgi:hypothetical protein
MEVSWQLHASADLPPGKEPPISVEKDAGWAPDTVEQKKSLPLAWYFAKI